MARTSLATDRRAVDSPLRRYRRILGRRKDQQAGDFLAYTSQPPEPLERRPRSPGGGEQDVGVQEDAVHASDPGGLVVSRFSSSSRLMVLAIRPTLIRPG